MTEPSLSFESNILPEEIRNEFKATESSEVNAECEELPDEEGLMSSYDCIILGTGLAESIVACALSRSGKTVLHLDKKDVYGGEAPSFNLTEFLSYCKEKKVHWETKYNAEGFNSASETKTVNGSIIKLFQEPQLAQCVQINDSTDAVADDHKNQAHICISSRSIYSKQSSRIHPSCFGYVMDRSTSSLPSKSSPESSATHPAFSGYLPNHVITPRRALFSSRHFCIDSGFRMLLASPSDATVKSLRDSDVSQYLEFKALETIYYGITESSSDIHTLRLQQVPSSKSDIFATTALTALEKRALMKFLQFTLDRGQFLHGGDNAVLDLNERELAIGRSLKRPQSTYTAAGVEANALLVHDEEDFMQYLNSQRLSPRLQGIIMHSLCFYPTTSSIKTGEALNRLQTSIDSIGIYGNTPFLIPMYGYSELCQAFCRMCAVWGGIYMLRRGVSEVHIDPLLSMPLNNNATECAESGACMSIRDSSGKTIKCKHFITNASYWPQAPKQSTIMVSR